MGIRYIYIIRNNVNNKVYIGQTRVGLKYRWYHHCKKAMVSDDQYICRAMRKHGIDNFFMEKLCECNIEDLDSLEIKYIKEYDSVRSGYNVSMGGKVYIPYRPDVDEDLLVHKYKTERHASMLSLSREFGISHYIVRGILIQHKVEIRNVAQPEVYLDIDKNILSDCISSGLSLRATARKIGKPYPTVRKAVRYHNIEYNFSKSARHPEVMN